MIEENLKEIRKSSLIAPQVNAKDEVPPRSRARATPSFFAGQATARPRLLASLARPRPHAPTLTFLTLRAARAHVGGGDVGGGALDQGPQAPQASDRLQPRAAGPLHAGRVARLPPLCPLPPL